MTHTGGVHGPHVPQFIRDIGTAAKNVFEGIKTSPRLLAAKTEVKDKLDNLEIGEKTKNLGKAIKKYGGKGAGKFLMFLSSFQGSEKIAKAGKELQGKEYKVGDGMRAKAKRLDKEGKIIEKFGDAVKDSAEIGSKRRTFGSSISDKGSDMITESRTLKTKSRHLVSEEVKGPSLAGSKAKIGAGKFLKGLGDKMWELGKKIGSSKVRSAGFGIEDSGKKMENKAKLEVEEAKIDKQHQEGLKHINSLDLTKEEKTELKNALDSHFAQLKQSHIAKYKEYLDGNSELRPELRRFVPEGSITHLKNQLESQKLRDFKNELISYLDNQYTGDNKEILKDHVGKMDLQYFKEHVKGEWADPAKLIEAWEGHT